MNSIKKIIVSILSLEARLVLKKYQPVIIAVTGSVGKTSAKDAIFDVLSNSEKNNDGKSKNSKKSEIRKSGKSFNSEFGVPLTILGLPTAWRNPFGWVANIFRGLLLLLIKKSDYPTTLILEVGADHPGDIENLTKWLKPDVAVMTKIADVPVHVEYFDSPAAVLREKLFLAKAVKKGGAVVLFGDDQKLKDLTFSGRTVMTFGMSTNANVRGSNPFIQYSTSDGIKKPTGISFKLDYAGNSLPINLDGVLGAAHVYPVLAAVTVGLIRGMSFSQIIKTTTDFNPPRGRMNIIDGMNGSTIIDDTYNSSPTAVESALAALGQVEGSGRKIAVLGDMMELGEYSTDQHKKMGQLVAGTLDASRGDMLVTVGQRARGIADSAIATGFPLSQIFSFDDSTTAGNELKKMIRTGDVILVKGSQSPRLERITKTLIADPTRATALLVRQESEWLAKK